MKTKAHRPNQPLPAVTARLLTDDPPAVTEENLRGVLCNPLYAGIGPYPAIVDDETWIHGAALLIRDEGLEQFLVNMLYVLRQSVGTGVPESSDEKR